jgi:hypothetical protein
LVLLYLSWVVVGGERRVIFTGSDDSGRVARVSIRMSGRDIFVPVDGGPDWSSEPEPFEPDELALVTWLTGDGGLVHQQYAPLAWGVALSEWTPYAPGPVRGDAPGLAEPRLEG